MGPRHGVQYALSSRSSYILYLHYVLYLLFTSKNELYGVQPIAFRSPSRKPLPFFQLWRAQKGRHRHIDGSGLFAKVVAGGSGGLLARLQLIREPPHGASADLYGFASNAA